MPPGVRLVAWNLKEPPVVIETSAVVVNPALFARTTLTQITTALANLESWIGCSVPHLIDRLTQAGVKGEVLSQMACEVQKWKKGTPSSKQKLKG